MTRTHVRMAPPARTKVTGTSAHAWRDTPEETVSWVSTRPGLIPEIMKLPEIDMKSFFAFLFNYHLNFH